MYEGIYLVFIRSLCIVVDILTVCYTFIHFHNIKYEYNITLKMLYELSCSNDLTYVKDGLSLKIKFSHFNLFFIATKYIGNNAL